MRTRAALCNVLNIDVDLVNDDYEGSKPGFDMGDSTYRHDGFSIGRDYLRLEGRTVSRGELLQSTLTVDSLIGQGAFSKVHVGTWTRKEGEIEVAIKCFSLFDISIQRRDMLLKELRALCNIDCKCLVQFHGAFLQDDTVTMVLEYMDRGSIEQLLQICPKTKLSERFVASIAYQMLWGLSYLHHEKIIHRDIKPGNVLIHSNGRVKLCDFGIVSLSDQSLHTTIVGTTRYMAPERLRAQPYGRSSDLWSFGLVLIECITGVSPWKDSDSIVSLVVTVEETPLEAIMPGSISSGLAEVLNASLNHRPGK
eukprot:scaffold6433_cov125-Cylindrotheca_fusiformis.AAC.7